MSFEALRCCKTSSCILNEELLHYWRQCRKKQKRIRCKRKQDCAPPRAKRLIRNYRQSGDAKSCLIQFACLFRRIDASNVGREVDDATDGFYRIDDHMWRPCMRRLHVMQVKTCTTCEHIYKYPCIVAHGTMATVLTLRRVQRARYKEAGGDGQRHVERRSVRFACALTQLDSTAIQINDEFQTALNFCECAH